MIDVLWREMAMLDICDDSARTLDDYQVELLRANLLDFHDCLVDEGSDIINAYDNSLIESIIQNHESQANLPLIALPGSHQVFLLNRHKYLT
jgi:hypothetical protein